MCDYYLPGYKSGGGMRTVANMVEQLGSCFDFAVITRDHDGRSDKTPYTTVDIGAWNRIGNADVFYVTAPQLNPFTTAKLINAVNPDRIYLNSVFSKFSIVVSSLKKLGLLRGISLIIAPEGEFSPGSLALKSLKKRAFLWASAVMRLHKDVVWKAASETEKNEILKVKGRVDVRVAPNLAARLTPTFSARPAKSPGSVKFAFVSRIARVKNLTFLLENLTSVAGDVQFDIMGPVEQPEYWREAQELIKRLPPHLSVNYLGPVDNAKVAEILSGYHFFVLPTLGESYGHVIGEALSAGCPVIISDRTPWKDLPAFNAGWDLRLEDPAAWSTVFQRCVDMSAAEHDVLSEGARALALARATDEAVTEANILVLSDGFPAEK